MENACQKNGFLTYSEYLNLDQFGKNGYHLNHKHNGMTNVPDRWPKALVEICKINNFQSIVEFGPGNAELGAETLLEAKKENLKLSWSGVEINPNLQIQAKKLFAKYHLTHQLNQLVSNIKDLKFSNPCLFIFSYSLDNLAPEVFVNTEKSMGVPNAMIGLTINNGQVSEKILLKEDLQKINIDLKNGIYKDEYSWDLNEWKINPMQRIYIPIEACKTLVHTIKILPPKSVILIIDEFSFVDREESEFHIGLPSDLNSFVRKAEDLDSFYLNAGSHLLYYPLYLSSTIDLLQKMGLKVQEEDEFSMVRLLTEGKRTDRVGRILIRAILTSPKGKIEDLKSFLFSFPYVSIKP